MNQPIRPLLRSLITLRSVLRSVRRGSNLELETVESRGNGGRDREEERELKGRNGRRTSGVEEGENLHHESVAGVPV